jgi:hypothetical protein
LSTAGGVVGDHPPAVHHRDALGQPVGLLQILGGEQDGGALGDQLADHVPQLVAAGKVEPGGRLVEEYHRRALYQRGGHVEAAAHPAGVGPHRPVGGAGELEALQQFVGPLPRLAAGQLREAPGQPEVLTAGQVGIDRRILAGEADPVADAVGVADHVVAEDLRVPAVGWEDGCQDPDRGGLAGAVGPEQPEHGTGRHLEVDAVEGDHVAEALDQSLYEDCGVAHDCRCSHDTSGSSSIRVLND